VNENKFIGIQLNQIKVAEPLPVPLYVYIDFRYILYRAKDDSIDPKTYARLELKKTFNLFVLESDLNTLETWAKVHEAINPEPTAEAKSLFAARINVERKTLDIFRSDHPDKVVAQALEASKKLLAEVMSLPLVAQPLKNLLNYSPGTVGHSINVSILSIYLAMQMGYAHKAILHNLALGGILHDIGKPKILLHDQDTPEVIEKKMTEHPTMGLRILESQKVAVPSEIKMIVAQHHECYDGSGYPKKLRGSNIYDLTRIVAIANTFDNIVADGKGPLAERQQHAILHLEQLHYNKFDPEKLEKSVRILKLGV
jgi:putative nucleotidyltransferase with HDIG domain